MIDDELARLVRRAVLDALAEHFAKRVPPNATAPSATDARVLTVRETARRINKSPRYVDWLIKAGHVSVIRMGNVRHIPVLQIETIECTGLPKMPKGGVIPKPAQVGAE